MTDQEVEALVVKYFPRVITNVKENVLADRIAFIAMRADLSEKQIKLFCNEIGDELNISYNAGYNNRTPFSIL